MTPYGVNDSLIRRAVAAYEARTWPEAESACAEILAENPDQADALQILGNIRARSGDTRAAEPLFERARAAAPDNIFILNSLGGIYAANGRPEQARAALEAALRIDSRFPWALHNLGSLMLEIGDRRVARRCFERALESNPNHVDAIAALADVAEQDEQPDEARALANRARRVAPDHVTARLVLARLELRAGSHATAEHQLRALLEQPGMRPVNQASARGLLGKALEGLGRYDEAFREYTQANDIERKLHAPRYADAEAVGSPATIARLTRFMQDTDPANWTRPAPDDLPSPVFLVGFPRSGTTLLEQLLAAHPGVIALEEQENLADAAGPLLLAPGSLERWDKLPPSELADLRRAYWKRVDAAVGARLDGRLFIDKLPLNLALLPLIHLLFPDAKIILVLRDPRDVILSCLRNRFAMNAAMFQFLSPETATGYYDAVMSLAEMARAKLPLSVHEVRYEDVVNDLRGTAGKLVAFLGLPWSDAVLNHVETARRRYLRTPSRSQVVRPIYRTSLAQWRNFEPQLTPVLPRLEHWVRRLDYWGSILSSSSNPERSK
jgi:tetratricopeptide (TPR) repeat protein